jgi:hypothetical protein
LNVIWFFFFFPVCDFLEFLDIFLEAFCFPSYESKIRHKFICKILRYKFTFGWISESVSVFVCKKFGWIVLHLNILWDFFLCLCDLLIFSIFFGSDFLLLKAKECENWIDCWAEQEFGRKFILREFFDWIICEMVYLIVV